MVTETKYLVELTRGEQGTVVDVDAENCPDRGRMRRPGAGRRGIACREGCASKWGAARRLMELGLTPGTVVRMTNSAPFNGPLEVCARGCRIALGRELASRILVNVEVMR